MDQNTRKDELVRRSPDTNSGRRRIHFIGICGVAMGALAIAFKKSGWKVTGSDAGFFPPVSTNLKDNEIDFYPGWHPDRALRSFPVHRNFSEGGSEGGKNSKDNDLVVVGNVASSKNPEWVYTQENNLNYKSYPEVVSEFFVKKNSIVCAGTYGKTSSSSLLSFILDKAGHNPSYMFGGLSSDMDSATITNSDWSVLEGDEYKTSRWDNSPKFDHYSPTHLLLTSLVWDHADIYPTEKSYFDAFLKLINSVPETGTIIACTDNAKVKEMTSTTKPKVVTYGKDAGVDYQYSDISQSKTGLTFSIKNKNNTYHIEANVLGDYQAANITACFAMAHEIGIDTDNIIKSIKTFHGIKRRLEKRFEGDVTVIDDIAHSPEKAKSVLNTLKSIYNGKIIAIFEPNTGNRKPASFPGYDHAFDAADEVIIPRLTKLKTAPDDSEPPVDGDELANIISKTHKNCKYVDDDKKIIELLRNTKKDDCIAFLGSRGFRGMIDELTTSLRQ